MNPSKSVFLVLLFVSNALWSSGLDWKEKTIELAHQLGEEELTASFEFSNNSEKVVQITDIRSSCGCTVPQLEKREFQPGESGTIAAVFTIGDRVGPQRKVLEVEVEDADGKTEKTVLTLLTTIRSLGTIHPRILIWKSDQPVSTQEVTIVLEPSVKFRVEAVGEFPFLINRGEEDPEKPEVRRLTFTPKEPLNAPSKSDLVFKFSLDGAEFRKEQKLFLLVR